MSINPLVVLKTKNFEIEQIDITPDTSMLPKSGKTGYNLTQAVAELVDNSIDARSVTAILMINVVIQSGYIKVEDNGEGMDKQIARKALVLGYSEKKNKLGEFGIGMKAACTSLGRKFRVTTTKKGLREGYMYEYDEESWLSRKNKNNWTDSLRIFEKNDPTEHGTSIEIEDLSRRVSKARQRDVLKDLANRFAPFLLTKQVIIQVNNIDCSPEEPELSNEGRKNFEITLSNGNKIYGWYGLLKHGSNTGHYGFNTFRRGRMITNYDKIGIFYHPTVSKIIGEINMNHVPVSSNKKGWEEESDEYIEAERLLKEEFKVLVSKARSSSLDEKVDSDIRDETERWKAEIVKAVRSEDLIDIIPPTDIRRKRTYNSDDPVGQVIVERRDTRIEEIRQEIKEKNERTRNPRKKQIVVSHFITIAGRNYVINHEFAHLGKDKGWKDVYYKSGEPIEVYTNKDFPAYAATSDLPFYAAIHIAESLGEIIANVNSEDTNKATEYRELILRKAAQMIEEYDLPSD